MKYRIHNINFERRFFGWSCLLTFSYPSSRQFTHESGEVCDVGRYFWTAYVRAWHLVRRHVATHGAKPGERKAKGWPENTKGKKAMRQIV